MGITRRLPRACIASIRFSIILALPLAASAQQLSIIDTIPVGKGPVRAVLTPDGRELYVSNSGDGTVTVIDTLTNKVAGPPLKVGKNPGALAVTSDGRHVYVGSNKTGVSVIDTLTKRVEEIGTEGPVRDLALRKDSRKLYLAMEFSGLNVLDTETKRVSPIPDTATERTRILCPEKLALAPDETRLYVSYQCSGPGGRPGHDAIGIFDLSTTELIGTIQGPPMVGGSISISPDGSQLWVDGIDACSQPAYDHEGCPSAPSRVVNVFRLPDGVLLKSFGFSLAEGDGPVSFSPKTDQVFIGGGLFLKVLDRTRLDRIRRYPIIRGGSLLFTSDGSRAYLTMEGLDVVALLSEGGLPSPEAERRLTQLRISDLAQPVLDGLPLEELPGLMQDRGLELTSEVEEEMQQRGVPPDVVRDLVDQIMLQLAWTRLP